MEEEYGVAAGLKGEKGQNGNVVSDGVLPLKRRRLEEEDKMVPEKNLSDLREQSEEEEEEEEGKNCNEDKGENLTATATENLKDFDGEKGNRKGRKRKVGRPKKQKKVGEKITDQGGDLGGKGDGNGEIVKESGNFGEKGEGFLEENEREHLDSDGLGYEIDFVKKNIDLADEKGGETCIGTDESGKEKLGTDMMASSDGQKIEKEQEEKVLTGNRRSLRQKNVKLVDQYSSELEKYFEEDEQGIRSRKRTRKGLKKKKDLEDDEENQKSRSRGPKRKKELDRGKDGPTSPEEDAISAYCKTTEAVQKRRGGAKTDENVFSVSLF